MNIFALKNMKKKINVKLMISIKKVLTQSNFKKKRTKKFSFNSLKNFDYDSAIVIFKIDKIITIIKAVKTFANIFNKRKKVKIDFDFQKRQIVNTIINTSSFTNNNNNNTMNRAFTFTTNNNNTMNRTFAIKQKNKNFFSFNDANDSSTNTNSKIKF